MKSISPSRGTPPSAKLVATSAHFRRPSRLAIAPTLLIGGLVSVGPAAPLWTRFGASAREHALRWSDASALETTAAFVLPLSALACVMVGLHLGLSWSLRIASGTTFNEPRMGGSPRVSAYTLDAYAAAGGWISIAVLTLAGLLIGTASLGLSALLV